MQHHLANSFNKNVSVIDPVPEAYSFSLWATHALLWTLCDLWSTSTHTEHHKPKIDAKTGLEIASEHQYQVEHLNNIKLILDQCWCSLLQYLYLLIANLLSFDMPSESRARACWLCISLWRALMHCIPRTAPVT